MGNPGAKKTFTDLELEILKILSDMPGGGTTQDVFEVISRERDTTQASINNQISVMHRAGMLAITRKGRPAKYAPAAGIKAKYTETLKQIAKRLFPTKSGQLLGIMLAGQSPKDRADAKRLIDEMD